MARELTTSEKWFRLLRRARDPDGMVKLTWDEAVHQCVAWVDVMSEMASKKFPGTEVAGFIEENARMMETELMSFFYEDTEEQDGRLVERKYEIKVEDGDQ